MTVQEVKDMAAAIISNVGLTLAPMPGPSGPRNEDALRDVLQLFVDKTTAARLHWREAALAEVLFLQTAPLLSDTELLQSVVRAEMRDALDGRTSITKVLLLLHTGMLLSCIDVPGSRSTGVGIL